MKHLIRLGVGSGVLLLFTLASIGVGEFVVHFPVSAEVLLAIVFAYLIGMMICDR